MLSLLGGAFADVPRPRCWTTRPTSSSSLSTATTPSTCTTRYASVNEAAPTITKTTTAATTASTASTTRSNTTTASHHEEASPTPTPPPQQQRQGVHLTVNSPTIPPSSSSAIQDNDTTASAHSPPNNNSNDVVETDHSASTASDTQAKTAMAALHTYHLPTTQGVNNNNNSTSLSALNVSKRKFCAWIQYKLEQEQQQQQQQQHTETTNSSLSRRTVSVQLSNISTRHVEIDNMDVRQYLRHLWNDGRLLTDRTEVLAIYKSERQGQDEDGVTSTITDDDTTTTTTTSRPSKPKRGGFSDLLHIYADRLFAIIQDETQDAALVVVDNDTYPSFHSPGKDEKEEEVKALSVSSQKDDDDSSSSNNSNSGIGLLGWLEDNYGKDETRQLRHGTMKDLTEKEQHEIMQHFLEWFRSRFPYYYDRCDSCGASAKDDPDVTHHDDDPHSSNDDDDDDDDDSGTFLGYVYPSPDELLGKASRTEIYQCHKCGSFTRFPRYNAASSVIQHGRGRCGEYSMLLYRFLRATGHVARWIVDWADHVWAEVRLNDKWIHLDPCEAAVNRPLLYEEWGKQQTYIVAFHAPPLVTKNRDTIFRSRRVFGRLDKRNDATFPLIEDVTLRYTSANRKDIQKRRDETEEELEEFVNNTIAELEKRLERILSQR